MIDSSPLHQRAGEFVLQKYGHSLEEIPEDIRSRFFGKRVVDIVEEMVDFFKLDVDPKIFFKERDAVFLDLVKKELQTLPGLVQSLQFFKNNNYKIIVASSGTKEFIDIVLDKFKIHKYYDAIVSGDEVSAGKPDPEPFLLATKKLGLKPEECVVLEDSANGVEAAKKAGCKCISIPYKTKFKQDVSKADLVLSSLEDINIDVMKLIFGK